jgi:septum formation protein
MTLFNKVYLASQSPRRRELISQVFKNIQFIDAPLDEPRWNGKQSPKEYIELCLNEKLRVGKEAILNPDENSFLLVADTIVVLGKKILGKPSDASDAERMLKSLSGKWHSVPTGITLAHFNRGQWRSENRIVESLVKFRKLSPKTIREYVRTGEPLDKAGAYGFQAKGLRLVEEIKGSYTNIIGLPVVELRELTQSFLNS